MRDLDKLLRDSLRQTGGRYRPDRRAEARSAFLRRLRRRRIVFGGSVALAGAGALAVVALVALNPPDLNRPNPDVAGRSLRVGAAIDVGRRPDGVAVGAGFVWVANSRDGTVSRVDPAADEVVHTIEVDGRPEDLAVSGGVLLVGDAESARLHRYDATTGDPAGRPARIPGAGGESLDLAPTDDAVWVVSPSAGLYRVEPATGDADAVPTDAVSATDVAVGGGSVWVLDDATDRLVRVDETSGNQIGDVPLDSAVSGANGDLAAGGGGVWIADGASRTVFRLDLEGGVRTAEISFAGSYASLTVSKDTVWVLTGNDAGTGSLLQVDANSGEQVGDALPLDGSPLDVVVGAGAIWVTRGDEISRIERAAPPPRSAGTPVADDVVASDEIVYAYAADGDVFVKEPDEERTVAGTPLFEGRPAWLDPGTILFQRGDAQDPAEDVRHMAYDVASSTTGTIGRGGGQSAFGSDGRAAWVVPNSDPARQAEISAGPSLDVQARFFAGSPNFERLSVVNLEWDSSGDVLYYEAGYARRGLYAVDVDTGDGDTPASIEVGTPQPVRAGGGAVYLAPSARAPGSIAVVRACCRGGGNLYRGAELGLLSFDASGASYTKIAGLDDVGFNVNHGEVTLEAAGTLDVESSPGEGPVWTITSTRSWIVGDGRALWLVDEEGEVDRLAPENVTGVAVNPALLAD